MNSICSRRISAADTPRDRPVMRLQSGEIHRQPPSPRPLAMDSHDAHRAAGPSSSIAPPAPRAVMSGSDAPKATDQDAAAMASCGAGAVERTGSVVAPALFADGPGLSCALPLSTLQRLPISRPPACTPPRRPQSVMAPCYPPRGSKARSLLQGGRDRAISVSPGRPPRLPDARGDRSRHQPSWPAGTRSGDKREVSLSPVPASHLPGDNGPRIFRLRVAGWRA